MRNRTSGRAGRARLLVRDALLDADARPRLARVKLLSLDVDGVLTDGGLYYDEDGRVQRRFSVLDGVGIDRVRAAGIAVAFISAGSTDSIRHRAATLGVDHVFMGEKDKLSVLVELAHRLGIGLDEVAHVGDDLNDVPALEAVGCPLAVANATAEALAAALVVTERSGGNGAVREVCEALLAARAGGDAR